MAMRWRVAGGQALTMRQPVPEEMAGGPAPPEQAAGSPWPICEAVYRQHYESLLAAACRVLRDRSAAEDAVQEAILRAARGLAGFSGRSSLSTWLYRITVNAAVSLLRRERRERRLREGLIRALRPAGDDPEGALDRAELRAHVRALMRRLQPHHRRLLHLRYHEECTEAEIAARLRCPPGTVKSRLHRARLALARQVRGDGAAEPGSRRREPDPAATDGPATNSHTLPMGARTRICCRAAGISVTS